MSKKPQGTLLQYEDFEIVVPGNRSTRIDDPHLQAWGDDGRIVTIAKAKGSRQLIQAAPKGFIRPLEEKPNLWREFESLDISNDDAILGFYRNYGWLGYDEDVRHTIRGEPVSWFKWEQRKFKHLVSLWRALTQRSSRQGYKKWHLQRPPDLRKVLDDLWEDYKKRDSLAAHLLQYSHHYGAPRVHSGLFPPRNKVEREDAAKRIICAEVNSQLSPSRNEQNIHKPPLVVRNLLTVGAGDAFEVSWRFDTLLQAVCLQFRQIVLDGFEPIECPSCHELFTPKHGKREVCYKNECERWRKRKNKKDFDRRKKRNMRKPGEKRRKK